MVSKFLTPIAHLFGGRAPEPQLTEAERAAIAEDERKRKETLKHLRGNDETRKFQRVVADFALREAGVAAAVGVAGVRPVLLEIMAGPDRNAFLKRAVATLKKNKATLGEQPVDELQAEALFGSAAIDEAARRRVAPLVGAVADYVMRELGVASALTLDSVCPTVQRILSGSHSLTFVDRAVLDVRESGATVLDAPPEADHVAACLASPGLADAVRKKLKALLDAEPMDAEPVDDDPDPDGTARRKTPPAA